MGLWVRSRDKRRLEKVTVVYIGKHNEEWAIYCNNAFKPLGIYSTEERCLVVLDELQSMIKASDKIRLVFQVPKE